MLIVKYFPCSATCRRPIKGAAERPIKSSELWNDKNFLFSPKITKTTSSSSSYTESRLINRVNSLPPSASFNFSSSSSSSSSSFTSKPVSTAHPAGQRKPVSGSSSLWIKLLLLAIMAALLFFVYQAMETNSIGPFLAPDVNEASDGTA